MRRVLATEIALVTAVMGLVVGAEAQGPRRDGRWEVMVEMNMPGMPGTMPPAKMEHCLTREQAEHPELLIPAGPAGSGMKNDCKVTDQEIVGNKVTWSMSCTMPQVMTATGELVYGDDTFEGVLKMLMQGQSMSMKSTGKRLGDCVP